MRPPFSQREETNKQTTPEAWKSNSRRNNIDPEGYNRNDSPVSNI